MKRLIAFVLLLSALLFSLLDTGTVTAAPPAQSGSCANTLSQPAGQDFWVGSRTPTNQNGPVVVFVHGYTSDHNTWVGGNYAVRDACNQGFRVAAVDLGGEASIWTNGDILRQRLQSIASYFGVSRVNVMAHSKGGLDTQTAIVHYGAYPYVQSYIAFGSPFGGTDLADHACSWYGFWLWQCNDATWSMRTGYMSYVRSITDGRAENNYVSAYAARGSKCDWYNPACGLISGPDDGVVPTWSAWANGVDSHISDRGDLRHNEVHQTQRYNSAWIFSYLGSGTLRPTGEIPQPELLFPRSDYTLRGGPLQPGTVERVTVEPGLEAVTFSLVTNGAAQVTLVAPDGTRTRLVGQRTAPGGLLQGLRYEKRVAQPGAGEWQIEMAPAGSGEAQLGYLLRTVYEGGITARLDLDVRRVYEPGSEIDVALTLESVASATMLVTLWDSEQAIVAQRRGATGGLSVTLPPTSGTYTLDLHVSGTTADGAPFERTLVTSVAAVDVDSVSDPASIR